MAEAEREELKRVTAKLRHPPTSLEEYEVQIILRAGDKAERPVGTPVLLTGPHRFMAIDYWWLRKNGMIRRMTQIPQVSVMLTFISGISQVRASAK
jgi:hypothetical protein